MLFALFKKNRLKKNNMALMSCRNHTYNSSFSVSVGKKIKSNKKVAFEGQSEVTQGQPQQLHTGWSHMDGAVSTGSQ